MLVFSNTSVSQTNSNPFIVVLDAGHGGKDPGRPTDFGYKEKDIALDIVLKIGNNLEKIEDIKVIYTRDKDVFIELRQRAKIANKADADLFVSVHCNAHNSQAYGTETYVLGLHRNDSNFRVAKLENEVIFLEDNF
jgi:N-acetylmuramoyl-L-alanine amidase